MAYKALVRPRLEYCASVWDPHTQCAVQRLEMVQRRAARYVMRRYHNTSSVTHMLDHLQWPLLSQRRSCLCLVFLYKIVNQLVAIPPDLYITSHQTNTRTHQHDFLPFLCSTNSYRHSFFPATVCQWNTLPDHIVASSSLNIFKAAVTQHVCSLPSLTL